jgi:hypothetical protein
VSRALLPDLLPVAPRPAADERLTGWLARTGALYAMTADEFLAACGVEGTRAIDAEWRLEGHAATKLAAPTRLAPAVIRAMTFDGLVPEARPMIGVGSRRTCPICARDGIERRGNAWPWSFRCPAHKRWLMDQSGRTLADWFAPATLDHMAHAAGEGALRLRAWSESRDRNTPSTPDLLRTLITHHRRPSPPSLAEQPRLSLQARWENRAFLTRPLRRQAVLAVVPEYDRVAPVLAKAMPLGADVLAEASLLQGFALVVGIGRLALDPARHLARVLSDCDEEGAKWLKPRLRAWPEALRAEILIELRCARRENRGSARPGSTGHGRAKRRQSHELRLGQWNPTPRQSHDCAPDRPSSR